MKIFERIPRERPNTPLLDQVSSPKDLKQLELCELEILADELREFLLYSVGQSGGHFGAGLGVVELTIALHYVFDTPDDRLVWDVGHQAYPHKILTGRREKMTTIRHKDGLAAFPNRAESEFDPFTVGHSSTSIGATLGMAIASRLKGDDRQHVAVIGDGALTAGMAFEALNHGGHDETDMIVILNDNDMSISENVGGMQKAFGRIFSSRTYSHMREGSKKVLGTIPPVWELAKRAEEHMKGMVTPGTLFEELGFQYFGPADGHDVVSLVKTLRNIKDQDGPKLLHVATTKGKGFLPAEDEPIKYHAISKIEPQQKPSENKSAGKKFSSVFGDWLSDMAALDSKLVGITPAMKEGSDMVAFAEKYPDRYFDVGIAEQHAVTLAAGMACEGLKPVVAIYSTFLQRAYDQLIHDVTIMNLDVLFAIDRAGLVGEDGPTHFGSFDLSYLRCIPNMIVMAPKDENECRQMLYTGYQHQGPAAVRYPRGTGIGADIQETMNLLPIGESEILRESQSKKVAVLAFGTLVYKALEISEELDLTVVNMRFIKPLDQKTVLTIQQSHGLIVTLEENSAMAGAGSAVNEFLAEQGIQANLLNLGIPDQYLEHGKPNVLLEDAGLDSQSIKEKILKRIT